MNTLLILCTCKCLRAFPLDSVPVCHFSTKSCQIMLSDCIAHSPKLLFMNLEVTFIMVLHLLHFPFIVKLFSESNTRCCECRFTRQKHEASPQLVH